MASYISGQCMFNLGCPMGCQKYKIGPITNICALCHHDYGFHADINKVTHSSNICYECKGKHIIECLLCENGAIMKKCHIPKCNDGNVPCLTCNGSKFKSKNCDYNCPPVLEAITITADYDTSKNTRYFHQVCSTCYGRIEPCNNCRGTGHKYCVACCGTGKIKIGSCDCSSKGFFFKDRVRPCPICT